MFINCRLMSTGKCSLCLSLKDILSRVEFSFSSCANICCKCCWVIHEEGSRDNSILPEEVVASGELVLTCAVELQFSKGGNKTDLLNSPQSGGELLISGNSQNLSSLLLYI